MMTDQSLNALTLMMEQVTKEMMFQLLSIFHLYLCVFIQSVADIL